MCSVGRHAGSLPSTLGGMTALSLLNLHSNSLTGEGREEDVCPSVRPSHLMFLLVLVFLACAVGGLLNGVCQFMSLCVSIVKLLLLFMAAVLSIFSIFAF